MSAVQEWAEAKMTQATARSRRTRKTSGGIQSPLPLWRSDADAIFLLTGRNIDDLPPMFVGDLILIVRVWQGGENAAESLARLLTRIEHKIATVSSRFTHPLIDEADMRQELRHRAILLIHRYRYVPGASFLSLVDSAMANHAMSVIRSLNCRTRRLPLLQVDCHDPAVEQMDPVALTDARASVVDLDFEADAMRDLSSDAQRLIDLMRVHGKLSFTVARTADMSAARYRIARAELRDWLQARMTQ